MEFKAKFKGFLARRAVIALPIFALIGTASADSVLNTTAIIGIFNDLTAIFPALGTFVIAVLPTLLMLAIVGFILGFFDKILGIFDRVF